MIIQCEVCIIINLDARSSFFSSEHIVSVMIFYIHLLKDVNWNYRLREFLLTILMSFCHGMAAQTQNIFENIYKNNREQTFRHGTFRRTDISP